MLSEDTTLLGSQRTFGTSFVMYSPFYTYLIDGVFMWFCVFYLFYTYLIDGVFYRCGLVPVGLLGLGPVGPTVPRRSTECRPGTREVRSRRRCIDRGW
jgi:hypothetical protein